MMSQTQAIELAKRYLTSTEGQRVLLESVLNSYPGPIDPVIEALKPPFGREKRKGEIKKEHFMAPGLRTRYPEDLLYFFVPTRYKAAKPFGLLIFMHGGDGGTPREKAGAMVSSPKEDPMSYGLRPRIEKAPFITVAPSAPRRGGGGQRWNVPAADDYIAAVIEECEYRFNIDGHRIFLGGHSMGAYGAYHLCQRLNDRIAGALLSAGAWKSSDFRCLEGTGVFLLHGRNDTAPGASPIKSQRTRRAKWTGVSFARAAAKLMKRDNVPFVYHEHDGGHAFRDANKGMAEFIQLAGSWQRNAFPKRVVALSPRGSWMIRPVTATPHSWWVSINKTGKRKIAYSAISLTGPNIAKTPEDLQKQGFALRKAQWMGGRIVAVFQDENTLDVQTENVMEFSIWLHPKMVDFSRPIVVIVDGKRKEFMARASLLDALRSYERRRDWGLIYHAEIKIER